MEKEKNIEVDVSTEEKIKEAARKVFSMKGYAGTRTRDIALESGTNVALVNYYFRSKEKLFDIVMQEKLYQLFGTIVPILINQTISLETKIEIITDTYIDMLLENPDLPIMVFNEIKLNPKGFTIKMQIGSMLRETSFYHQICERNSQVDPLQFVLSFLGILVFPFIARPIFVSVGDLSKEEYSKLMKDRKNYILKWANALLDA